MFATNGQTKDLIRLGGSHLCIAITRHVAPDAAIGSRPTTIHESIAAILLRVS